MMEQQAILDSIRDDAGVEANRRLIRQRQAESDTLFNELDAEIKAEEVAPEQLEGAELWQPSIYPSKGTEIVDIFDKE
ncbi:hypothetical protein D1007_41032 [Hordeum vulgare]|nr:hypothetical protein D1007_41032 [Hordeum vulgare]